MLTIRYLKKASGSIIYRYPSLKHSDKSRGGNATFASVLKLMKEKVDKEQAAENVNKIRQTKTGDVLVQLQRNSNATHLKETIATEIGRKI